MRELTGQKVFAITASAFTVIIGVNLVLATQAIRTFPGLEVKNSYVASQTFDADRSRQEALGWVLTPDYKDGVLSLAVLTEDGSPADVRNFTATVGRATHVRDDLSPEFTWNNGVFSTPADLGPGNWNFRLVAIAGDGTDFRQRVPFRVKP